MNDNALKHKVLKLFSDQFGIPRKDLTMELELKTDLNATKLELADFFSLLENAFAVKIEQQESENFQTIGDIVNFIVDHGTFT